jgi:hypothetical protein
MIRLFGSTINETIEAFKPIHLGANQSKASKEDKTKAIGRIVVSILLLFLATYLFTINDKDVGSTIIGALIGYWIK